MHSSKFIHRDWSPSLLTLQKSISLYLMVIYLFSWPHDSILGLQSEVYTHYPKSPVCCKVCNLLCSSTGTEVPVCSHYRKTLVYIWWSYTSSHGYTPASSDFSPRFTHTSQKLQCVVKCAIFFVHPPGLKSRFAHVTKNGYVVMQTKVILEATLLSWWPFQNMEPFSILNWSFVNYPFVICNS